MSDWKLVSGTEELVLGKTLSGVGLESPPQVASPDIGTDDMPLPRSDGMAMGVDFIGGTFTQPTQRSQLRDLEDTMHRIERGL